MAARYLAAAQRLRELAYVAQLDVVDSPAWATMRADPESIYRLAHRWSAELWFAAGEPDNWGR